MRRCHSGQVASDPKDIRDQEWPEGWKPKMTEGTLRRLGPRCTTKSEGVMTWAETRGKDGEAVVHLVIISAKVASGGAEMSNGTRMGGKYAVTLKVEHRMMPSRPAWSTMPTSNDHSRPSCFTWMWSHGCLRWRSEPTEGHRINVVGRVGDCK